MFVFHIHSETVSLLLTYVMLPFDFVASYLCVIIIAIFVVW